MIREVHGDILHTTAQAIAHGVAPGDHFTQGLALALREKYPTMAKDFRHYSHQCHPKPGDILEWGRYLGVGRDRELCIRGVRRPFPTAPGIPQPASRGDSYDGLWGRR